jgi:thioredoxin-like negative regulator of GroEL
MFAPVANFEKLANDYNGQFLLVNVDTNKEKQRARDCGVDSMPTVKFLSMAK